MKAFQYAAPRSEAEILSYLSDADVATELLAGGTDLVGLMKKMVVTPDRVVYLKEVSSMRGIRGDSTQVVIGAVTTLEEMLESPQLDAHGAVKDAIRGKNSMQLVAQGTLGGDLCRRPECWYFRSGAGLAADVSEGDTRYHAIFANDGPAKFVSASRLAPALVALDARARIYGPSEEDETLLPLEHFYQTPFDESRREHVVQPGQVLTHVSVPVDPAVVSATYEVHHGSGPEPPLATAAAALAVEGGVVSRARIVLGQVAPTPWVSDAAAAELIGRPIDLARAEAAGQAAVREATPLADNQYKVQLASTAVTRAILQAAGMETGGF